MDDEVSFVAQYEGPQAKKAARELYRAMHPGGMDTNGPTIVRIEASHLNILLGRWRRPDGDSAAAEYTGPENIEAYCEPCKRQFVSSWVSVRTKAARCPICGGKLREVRADSAEACTCGSALYDTGIALHTKNCPLYGTNP